MNPISQPSVVSYITLSTALAMVACQTSTVPSEQDIADEPILPECYIDRRIGGRESIQIAEGVTVHADRKVVSEEGPIQVTGRVFLDGHSNPDAKSVWPQYGYADSAKWDAASHTLSMQGSPVIEYRHATCTAYGTLVLDGESVKGANHTEVGRRRDHLKSHRSETEPGAAEQPPPSGASQ